MVGDVTPSVIGDVSSSKHSHLMLNSAYPQQMLQKHPHIATNVACSTAQTTGVDAALHAGDKVTVAVCSAHEPRRRQASTTSAAHSTNMFVKQPALAIHLHTRADVDRLLKLCGYSHVSTTKRSCANATGSINVSNEASRAAAV